MNTPLQTHHLEDKRSACSKRRLVRIPRQVYACKLQCLHDSSEINVTFEMQVACQERVQFMYPSRTFSVENGLSAYGKAPYPDRKGNSVRYCDRRSDPLIFAIPRLVVRQYSLPRQNHHHDKHIHRWTRHTCWLASMQRKPMICLMLCTTCEKGQKYCR